MCLPTSVQTSKPSAEYLVLGTNVRWSWAASSNASYAPYNGTDVALEARVAETLVVDKVDKSEAD
jgi:hypothetical protein